MTAMGICAGYIHLKFLSVQSHHTNSRIPQSVKTPQTSIFFLSTDHLQLKLLITTSSPLVFSLICLQLQLLNSVFVQ